MYLKDLSTFYCHHERLIFFQVSDLIVLRNKGAAFYRNAQKILPLFEFPFQRLLIKFFRPDFPLELLGFPFVFHVCQTYLASTEGFFIFRMLFLVISFVSGLLIGSQFPLANKLYLSKSTSLSKTAGLLYASDLLGGWLGGVVGAVVLLPVLGLTGTCLAVGLLKLTSFTVIATQPDRYPLGG